MEEWRTFEPCLPSSRITRYLRPEKPANRPALGRIQGARYGHHQATIHGGRLGDGRPQWSRGSRGPFRFGQSLGAQGHGRSRSTEHDHPRASVRGRLRRLLRGGAGFCRGPEEEKRQGRNRYLQRFNWAARRRWVRYRGETPRQGRDAPAGGARGYCSRGSREDLPLFACHAEQCSGRALDRRWLAGNSSDRATIKERRKNGSRRTPWMALNRLTAGIDPTLTILQLTAQVLQGFDHYVG